MSTVNTTTHHYDPRASVRSLVLLAAALLFGIAAGIVIVDATDGGAATDAAVITRPGVETGAPMAPTPDLTAAQLADAGRWSGLAARPDQAVAPLGAVPIAEPLTDIWQFRATPVAPSVTGPDLTAAQLADAGRWSGLAARPDQAVAPLGAVPVAEPLTDIWQFRSASGAASVTGPVIEPEPVTSGYSYSVGTFVPPAETGNPPNHPFQPKVD